MDSEKDILNRLLKLWDSLQLSLFDEPVVDRIKPRLTSETSSDVRGIVLGQQMVHYQLERARRKTVGMIVDAKGLRVRAPSRVSIAEIERILLSKASWILKSLARIDSVSGAHDGLGGGVHTHMKRNFVPDLLLEDGAVLSLLGREMVIRWGKHEQLPIFHSVANELWVKIPKLRKPSEASIQAARRDAVANALGVYLLKHMNERAAQLAQMHGLSYQQIVLSNARTLWGTCRRDGLIRLNWRLVFLEQELAEYVLAHELAHTVQMNHSAKFWLKVGQLCPDYASLRKRLRHYDLRNS